MQVGTCIPVGTQLQKAGVGPISGATWRLSHCGIPIGPGVARSSRQGARSPQQRRVGDSVLGRRTLCWVGDSVFMCCCVLVPRVNRERLKPVFDKLTQSLSRTTGVLRHAFANVC